MKTFKQFLKEAPPLPDDWDKEVYTPDTSFKKKVDYALERAKKLGAGSSRVVFDIEHEGRQTALKIAKNKKGLAQNSKEADYGLYQMYPDITTPIIDYDEEHDYPIWIHTEKAEKMTKAKFKKLTGMNFDNFNKMLRASENDRIGHRGNFGGLDFTYGVPEEEKEAIAESEFFYDVDSLLGNFDILSGDLSRIANWGIYNGRPVIIDLGFSSDVQKDYYS
jgi:hypothetical protein